MYLGFILSWQDESNPLCSSSSRFARITWRTKYPKSNSRTKKQKKDVEKLYSSMMIRNCQHTKKSSSPSSRPQVSIARDCDKKTWLHYSDTLSPNIERKESRQLRHSEKARMDCRSSLDNKLKNWGLEVACHRLLPSRDQRDVLILHAADPLSSLNWNSCCCHKWVSDNKKEEIDSQISFTSK